MLADIPVPQRQRQALGAHHAGGAHGDRGGRLLAGFAYLHTDREPLVGIQAAARATGVPDNPHPQRPIGAWDGHRWIRWPTRGPVHGRRGRPVIRRCWGPRNSHLLPPSRNPRHRGRPGRQRSCHAPLASRAGTGLTIAAGSECRLLPMGATGPPHSVAVRPPGWRWSHPRGTRWYASGCRTGGHALGRSGADAECCGRAADSQPLTVRPPRPRKAAAASATSMTGTSRIARILTPGAYVDPAPLAARPSRLRRVSRWRQYRSGHDRDSSCSSRGFSWALVSFVNVANINLRRGSPACSECSIRPRTRSWRAGRLIKSAPDTVPRRGTDLGRSESSSSPPLRRGDVERDVTGIEQAVEPCPVAGRDPLSSRAAQPVATDRVSEGASSSAYTCRGQVAGWTLAERHAVPLKRLLQKLSAFGPTPCSFFSSATGTFAS